MKVNYNGRKFNVSRELKVYTKTLFTNKQKDIYNVASDINEVNYFYLPGTKQKVVLENCLNRFGIMGFDLDCEIYPKNINCYDSNNIYHPIYIEICEPTRNYINSWYGYNVKVWTEL